jgi:nucleotide-binding universal stress UspA family protein
MLAKTDKAHISVVHTRSRPVPPTTVYFPLGGISTEFTETFQKAEDALADGLKQVFTKLCKDNGVAIVDLAGHTDERGVTVSWLDVEGDLLSYPASFATACDLSVIAAAGDDATPMELSIVESLLFQSGRPVLLCPETGLASAPKKIIVAWNASEEAAHATGASLGLLQAAEEVNVVTVRKAGEPLINTDEITAYLRLHGVNAARAKIEVTGDENPAARLDKEILEEQPDLLVMGAYSHNRWRQAVLGGFTRHIIHRAKLPVFMMR